MSTGVGRGKICLASFNSPTPKPPVIRKDLGDICYIGRVMSDFVRISLPWQRWLVAVEFVWRHSIARPRKTPGIRNVVGDISYIGRVIADFVSKFVAMATEVGRSRICLASFNSPTPKTPCYTQRSLGYLLYKPSYS